MIDQNSDQYIFLARLGLKVTIYGLSWILCWATYEIGFGIELGQNPNLSLIECHLLIFGILRCIVFLLTSFLVRKIDIFELFIIIYYETWTTKLFDQSYCFLCFTKLFYASLLEIWNYCVIFNMHFLCFEFHYYAFQFMNKVIFSMSFLCFELQHDAFKSMNKAQIFLYIMLYNDTWWNGVCLFLRTILLVCFESVYFLYKPINLSMQKAAIKKMDMQASKEFLAELKVLTRVHHLNLVLVL